MDAIVTGFGAILDVEILLWISSGVLLGYVVGAMPGLGKGTATAVAIPLTFYISPLASISFLIGIAKGSTAGSAVSAILLNTPGEPSSAPTAFDGYPLSRQGKAQKALKMGLFASVIGDICSTIALIALAEPLARYALLIGPVELTAILLFSLTFIAGLSTKSLLKGLISGCFGILFATIGTETETAVQRFTFGFLELFDGLSIIPVAIGMLATAEMIRQAANRATIDRGAAEMAANMKREDRIVTLAEWRACLPSIARGSGLGIAIGILPGLGATVASFLSYGMAQRAADDPGRFGKGALEGVAAAESADNAVIPASFVPLFALGIPGNVIAAILIGAFLMHGVTPGPLVFQQQPTLIYGIYAAMLFASMSLLAIGYFGQRYFARAVQVRLKYIIPVVFFLCSIGAYLQGGGLFGIAVMVFFGVLGFLFNKFGYSFVTFLIGFVIGPSFELSLRQALALTDAEIANLADHPIAIVFCALTVATAVGVALRRPPNEAAANAAQTSQSANTGQG